MIIPAGAQIFQSSFNSINGRLDNKKTPQSLAGPVLYELV
jgi:hypothetical protein